MINLLGTQYCPIDNLDFNLAYMKSSMFLDGRVGMCVTTCMDVCVDNLSRTFLGLIILHFT